MPCLTMATKRPALCNDFAVIPIKANGCRLPTATLYSGHEAADVDGDASIVQNFLGSPSRATEVLPPTHAMDEPMFQMNATAKAPESKDQFSIVSHGEAVIKEEGDQATKDEAHLAHKPTKVNHLPVTSTISNTSYIFNDEDNVEFLIDLHLILQSGDVIPPMPILSLMDVAKPQSGDVIPPMPILSLMDVAKLQSGDEIPPMPILSLMDVAKPMDVMTMPMASIHSPMTLNAKSIDDPFIMDPIETTRDVIPVMPINPLIEATSPLLPLYHPQAYDVQNPSQNLFPIAHCGALAPFMTQSPTQTHNATLQDEAANCNIQDVTKLSTHVVDSATAIDNQCQAIDDAAQHDVAAPIASIQYVYADEVYMPSLLLSDFVYHYYRAITMCKTQQYMQAHKIDAANNAVHTLFPDSQVPATVIPTNKVLIEANYPIPFGVVFTLANAPNTSTQFEPRPSLTYTPFDPGGDVSHFHLHLARTREGFMLSFRLRGRKGSIQARESMQAAERMQKIRAAAKRRSEMKILLLMKSTIDPG